jgi:hypothetical protein
MKEMQGKAPEDLQLDEVEPVNRLCNEIRLFDLCDLDRCNDISGVFCTNSELLARFEKIADDDVRHAVASGFADHDDEDGDFSDGFDDEEFGDDQEGFDQD